MAPLRRLQLLGIFGAFCAVSMPRTEAEQLAPREAVVTRGASIAAPDNLAEFVASVEIGFVGELTAKAPRFWNDGAQEHIVSELSFHVTKAFKGSSPGETHVLSLEGGTYLVMPDQTLVPRRVSEEAAPLLVGGEYFVTASTWKGKPFLMWADAMARIDGSFVTSPRGSDGWITLVVAAGRAQLLLANPGSNPTAKESFFRALSAAFGTQP